MAATNIVNKCPACGRLVGGSPRKAVQVNQLHPGSVALETRRCPHQRCGAVLVRARVLGLLNRARTEWTTVTALSEASEPPR